MLNDTQKNNAIDIINVFRVNGIINPFTIAAVLSVCMKETTLKPISENLYYKASTILRVWTRITFEKAKQLEFKPVELGNYVYGDQPTGYRSKSRSLGNGEKEAVKIPLASTKAKLLIPKREVEWVKVLLIL